jgi:hypothetical protein
MSDLSQKLPQFKYNDTPQINRDNQKILTDRQTFAAVQNAFKELEAQGASDFAIFNGLAELFYQRDCAEVSELLAEAAYHCYQQSQA